MHHHLLDIKTVGIALGLFWALSVFILGLTSLLFNYGTDWVTLLSGVYMGYSPTWGGIFMGTLWGFFDGLIGGVLFALIYNWVSTWFHAKP